MAHNGPKVLVCGMCAMKPGPNFHLYKDSCMICGSVVTPYTEFASLCIRHGMVNVPNGMFKCSNKYIYSFLSTLFL
jgi:hypothetical protein